MIMLSVDYGDARTGIAVCDKYEMMASEAGCVKADSYKKALAAVGEKVSELRAELVVVGNPVNMNGTMKPAKARRTDCHPVFMGLPPDRPAAAKEARATGGVRLANMAK